MNIIAVPVPYPIAYTAPLISSSVNALATQVSGTGTTAKIFTFAGSSTLASNVQAPGLGRLEGELFTVSASGEAYSAGSTLAVSLFAVNATTWASGSMASQTTPGSWTLLYTTATPISIAAIEPWSLTATMVGGTQGGVMNGTIQTYVGTGAVEARVKFTNALTLASTSPGGMQVATPVVFAVGLTFGTSLAANTGQLDYFVLEA